MEGLDRVLAVVFTLIAIGAIILITMVLVVSFVTHPIASVVLLVATIWLFRKIYPHVVRFMEKEGF